MVGVGDHILVRLIVGIVAVHFIRAIETAAAEERVAVRIEQRELHERTSARIATGELVARKVQEPHIDEGGVGIAVDDGDIEFDAPLLQVVERARYGAVELHVVRGNAERLAVHLHQLQHEHIATRQVMQAEG